MGSLYALSYQKSNAIEFKETELPNIVETVATTGRFKGPGG